MRKNVLILVVLVMGIMISPAVAQNADRDVIPGYQGSTVISDQDQAVPQTGTYYAGSKSSLLYDNGSFISHFGAGTNPDTSRLQSTSLAMGTFGFGHQLSALNRVADDITVTNIWQIDSIVFFAYQTGSTLTSTFNHYNLRVWDANPSGAANLIWGDTTTNVLTSTYWSGVYRDQEGTPGTTRPIMRNVVTTTGLVLNAGTFWLDWQAGGTLASGPWAVPVVILGNSTTGNAWQRASGVWAALLDVGPQGLPFEIWGTILYTGIDEVDGDVALKVYPNPSTDVTRVVSSEIIEEIELIDALGRVVFLDRPLSNLTSLSVADLVAGIYTIRVRSASGMKTEPLMVY